MTTYDFYDEFTLELRGDNDVVDRLRQTYRHFESDAVGAPDLVCEGLTAEPDPDVLLGGDEEYYGRAGDDFVIRTGWGEQIVADRDWTHVRVGSGSVHHHVAYLVEFEVRKRLAARGRALIHASGVQLDGQTFAFPAWRHAGKTNTMVSLLRAGGDYLADDRLWVEADGTVTGYPLPVNVRPSNYHAIDGGVESGRFDRVRSSLSDAVYDRVDVDRSLVDKVLYFLSKYYLEVEDDTLLLPVEDLVPGAEYVADPVPLDAAVFLRTTLEPYDGRIEVQEISRGAALTDVVNVSHYEWNDRLLEYFMAYDVLFDGPNRAGELESLIEAESRIVSRLFDETPTYRALIPRSRDWQEAGIEEAVVDGLTGLRQPTPVGQHG